MEKNDKENGNEIKRGVEKRVKKEVEKEVGEEVEKEVEVYLTSGSLSNTKDVSLSHVKLNSTFGAVLFLLLTVM